MEKDIEKILQELYEVDSSLKEKEKELRKIIHTMLNLKPNVKIDETFKSTLRENISKKIVSEKLKNYSSQKQNIWHFFAYIFGTAWILAFWFFLLNENLNIGKNDIWNPNTPITTNNILSFESEITKISGWFGDLKNIWENTAPALRGVWGWATPSSAKMLQTESVSRDIWTEDMQIATETPLGDEMTVGKTMDLVDPNWVPEIYRYSFSGELNVTLSEMMPVYKKSNQNNLGKDFWKKFANFRFNGLDISRFSDLSAGNISFNQDKEYGYSINIDFSNGYLNIYKNWDTWPQKNYQEKKTTSLLAEDEVLNIANSFMKEYGIDISQYGHAKIETNYNTLLKTSDVSRIMPDFIPDTTYILYPLIVDGKEIMEESWDTAGIKVEIDTEEKRVSSVVWLSIQNYVQSDYIVENNTENILKVANVWGRFWFYTPETDRVKYKDIELKNPTLKYINIYEYKNNIQEQYLIPAVVFEVEKEGLENYYWNTISVPLVKDFYKYDKNGNIVWNSQE